jgi:tetratricopeptide (TPR) repeat protein
MQEKNFSAARDALERAIAIDEDFHPARHGLARCLVQIRDLLGAREHFNYLLRKIPDDSAVMKDQAVVLDRLGEIDQAVQLRARAIEQAPDDARLLSYRISSSMPRPIPYITPRLYSASV